MFADEHDFKRYPELTTAELVEFGFMSPHEQIEEDFFAVVVKVHDGDTVTLRCDFRDFEFPLRLAEIDAPELSTGTAGEEAREYLRMLCEGKEVYVKINRDDRVEKWGRLMGDIIVDGQSAGYSMLLQGYCTVYEERMAGELPNLDKDLAVKKWF